MIVYVVKTGRRYHARVVAGRDQARWFSGSEPHVLRRAIRAAYAGEELVFHVWLV